MASSKVFLLLGLAFAVVLLISFEVSARDLAEITQTQEAVQTNFVEKAKHGHGHHHSHDHDHDHHHGHGHDHDHRHYGHPGHGVTGETETNQN